MTDTTLKNLPDITATTRIADSDLSYITRPGTDADYKTSMADLKTYMAPSKPQIIATHTATPNGTYAANTGGRSDTQLQVRTQHFIGCREASQIQIGMIGSQTTPNVNTGDTGLGHTMTWEAGIEIGSPALTRQCYFNGAKSVTFQDKSPLVLTDPITLGVNAGETINIRQNFTIPDSTGKFLTTARDHLGNNVLSTSTTSQVANTGSLTTPGGGATTYCRTLPVAIIGIPKTPMPSVLIIGDSVALGYQDANADARGMKGFVARGLDNVNGYAVPWHAQTVSGWALEGQKLVNAPLQRDLWKYCTHVLFQIGINDMFGSSLSAIQDKTTAVLTELKRTIGPYGKPLHITCTTITPNASSSNSYIDAAGQTLSGSFVVGGIRDQYNAWLLSLVGGSLVDQVLDLRTVTDDPANPGKWYTNGISTFPTSDGIHPKTGMVTRMAALVNNWALGLKP